MDEEYAVDRVADMISLPRSGAEMYAVCSSALLNSIERSIEQSLRVIGRALAKIDAQTCRKYSLEISCGYMAICAFHIERDERRMKMVQEHPDLMTFFMNSSSSKPVVTFEDFKKAVMEVNLG